MTANTPTAANIRERLLSLVEDMKALDTASIEALDLVPLVKAAQDVTKYVSALDAEIRMRAIVNGEVLPGVAVKPGITHRKWSDEAAAGELAYAELGLKAFKLLSPAQVEKLGDAGAALVAVASFKPEAEERVVY